jgi:hypothetical protein
MVIYGRLAPKCRDLTSRPIGFESNPTFGGPANWRAMGREVGCIPIATSSLKLRNRASKARQDVSRRNVDLTLKSPQTSH